MVHGCRHPALTNTSSHEFGDRRCGSCGSVGADGEVVDRTADLVGDQLRQRVGIGGVVVVEAAAGAVSAEAVIDVEVLLEVVAQGDVEERAAVGGELHAGRQPALHDGDIAGREMAVQVGDEAPIGDTSAAREPGRVDPWAADDDEAEAIDEATCRRHGVDDTPQQ